MEIIIILFLVLFLGVIIFLIFRIIKWIINKKIRTIWVLSIVGVLVLGISINKLFFEKMEFIQSKVYPDLFLIKHPNKNRDSLHKYIENKIIKEMKSLYTAKKDSLINSTKNTTETSVELRKRLRFYTYTSAWGFSNGTAHFIENKEDPGGFSSEMLSNYQEHQLAYFSFNHCENHSTHYKGELYFYENGIPMSQATQINSCD